MNLPLPERRRYYASPEVRRRIGEFFGDTPDQEATAAYFCAGNDARSMHQEHLPLAQMAASLDQGAEINRSLWDRGSLLADIDIEYVNFDSPADAYLDPERTFKLQLRVQRVVIELLASHGIVPLHLVTGRGHHFVWRMAQSSATFASLVELGHMSDSLKRLYASSPSPAGDIVSEELGSAYSGLGLVMEFIAHEVKQRAAPLCEIPVELGAIEVGRTAHGREMVSLDITEYADPLTARSIRSAFSLYLKPWQQSWLLGEENVGKIPPLCVVPASGENGLDAIRASRDLTTAMSLAGEVTAEIPDQSAGTEALINAYRSSPLAKFHEWFYAEEHDPVASWPSTYDKTDLTMLPPCARLMIERPNDFLLRPGCVERVVRVLLALGWHPRHIAGLIRSKYERDHGWGHQWDQCDPATRADFYARVFTGLFVTGVDNLVDFNCQSGREEGLCFVEGCTSNLDNYRSSLLKRRQYERLAHRPFHRLFFPVEHP